LYPLDCHHLPNWSFVMDTPELREQQIYATEKEYEQYLDEKEEVFYLIIFFSTDVKIYMSCFNPTTHIKKFFFFKFFNFENAHYSLFQHHQKCELILRNYHKTYQLVGCEYL